MGNATQNRGPITNNLNLSVAGIPSIYYISFTVRI